ncbi:MAG: hypothetical protein IJV68_01890 [Clostridia bacterium]|nr:hypothetical protein [Clostridia bacterium]
MENKYFNIQIENGRIVGLFSCGEQQNMVNGEGATGTIGYTFISDDIRNQEKKTEGVLFYDRVAEYEHTQQFYNKAVCSNAENGIKTIYELSEDRLDIQSRTTCELISQYALNFDLNFLNSETGSYKTALLATSPYTSDDGEQLYYILTRPDGRFMVILSRKKCDGWRLFYGRNQKISRLQIIASFDKVFGSSGCKEISVSVFFADSIDEAYERISELLDRPLLKNIVSGGFDGKAAVGVVGKATEIRLCSPTGVTSVYKVTNKKLILNMSEYGYYTATPYYNEKKGLNTVLWNGIDSAVLFNKCTDAIKKPYHNDENLCEGGMFLWSMLANMRSRRNLRYDKVARDELDIIMCRNNRIVPCRTIVPYRTEKYAPYHVCDSGRIQEQFVGASILLEAYRLYHEREYLDYAVKAMDELLENYYKGGMIFNGNGEDYTTVVTPMIPVVDLAIELKDIDPEKSDKYRRTALEMAEYLLSRGLNFPTEGASSKYEDGSISCTALSLVYLCANLNYDERYLAFAKEVLDIHKAWTIYTPDARMYGSSFRWWETIWEGDGEGHAICAGHAWTIWKAEALFWYGIMTGDKEALCASWNGFVTNFAKATEDGNMYSCYEPDYIRGGGRAKLKATLLHLQDGVKIDSFAIAHGYPKHTDNSLSRYAWVRYTYTWGSVKVDYDLFDLN